MLAARNKDRVSFRICLLLALHALLSPSLSFNSSRPPNLPDVFLAVVGSGSMGQQACSAPVTRLRHGLPEYSRRQQGHDVCLRSSAVLSADCTTGDCDLVAAGPPTAQLQVAAQVVHGVSASQPGSRHDCIWCRQTFSLTVSPTLSLEATGDLRRVLSHGPDVDLHGRLADL